MKFLHLFLEMCFSVNVHYNFVSLKIMLGVFCSDFLHTKLFCVGVIVKSPPCWFFPFFWKKTCKKFLCTRIQSFVDCSTIILILFSGKKIKANWRFKKVKASSRTTKRFCFFYQRQFQQKKAFCCSCRAAKGNLLWDKF